VIGQRELGAGSSKWRLPQAGIRRQSKLSRHAQQEARSDAPLVIHFLEIWTFNVCQNGLFDDLQDNFSMALPVTNITSVRMEERKSKLVDQDCIGTTKKSFVIGRTEPIAKSGRRLGMVRVGINFDKQTGNEKKILSEVFGEKCNEGEFTGTKRSCDMYYVCVHGRRVEFRCQGGLQWNEKGKYCDWPNNVKCTPSSQPITLPPTEEIPTESTTAFPTQVPWITQSPVVVSPTTSTIVTKPTTLKPPTEIVRPPSSPLSGKSGINSYNFITFARNLIQMLLDLFSGDYKIVCYFTNWVHLYKLVYNYYILLVY